MLAKMMRSTHWFPPVLLAGCVGLGLLAHAQDAAPAQEAATEAKPASRVIEGRVNPYSYNPTNTEGHTDVDLRAIFEGLGPVATEWYQHVLTLSNPFFEGRVPASRGSVIAGEYIEFYFKQSGLEPAFPETVVDPAATDGSVIVAASIEGATAPPSSPSPHPDWTSWRQQFDLAGAGPKLVSASAEWSKSNGAAANGAATNVSESPTTLKRGEGYSVLGNSASGKVSGPLSFAGYAITEGKDGYTSFAESKEDFSGRIVMFMRYEPLDDEGKSLWADRRFSPSAAVAPKMEAVIARNPAAIIMVNPPGARDARKTLETSETSRFGARLAVPVIQMSPEAADELIRAADGQGRSLMDLRKLCDKGDLMPMNFRDGVTLTVETELTEGVIQTHNLGGVLRGKGALADQWVIIGAHYDHVGFGNYGADPSNRGKLHPGADDNASGTSAMLCLVKLLAEYYRSDEAPAEMRSVLFMGFSAEEVGLNGSDFWTKHPTLKNEQVQAMINLDMVGRMRNDELAISGTGTAKDFMNDLRPIFDASGLTIRADPSGRGPSDHASFYRAGIPVLFLFTGSHNDYHKPTDHGYTVNPQGAARVVALTESLLKMMATRADKFEFASNDGAATPGRPGNKVRFGVMPGYGESEIEGVRVEGVSAETSASDAGILQGDLLIGWGELPLTGPADLMSRLREHKPGDVVKVKLKRGTDEMVVEVTLRAAKTD
ncbi:MAG: M28 family peptidase [Phycisphaerales bacterium]|nr:M28 family peptidase [Phycisphaerales bacterium]